MLGLASQRTRRIAGSGAGEKVELFDLGLRPRGVETGQELANSTSSQAFSGPMWHDVGTELVAGADKDASTPDLAIHVRPTYAYLRCTSSRCAAGATGGRIGDTTRGRPPDPSYQALNCSRG